MSAPAPADKKSKFKFSSLLHSKDKPNPTSANDTPPANLQRNSNTDSGYGGSEPSYGENAAPPSLTGSDESQYVPPKDSNGQTVTTTTTTTTTTTSGGGGNTSIENNAPTSAYGNERGSGGSPPIPVRSSLRERSPNPSQQQHPAAMQGTSGVGGIRDRSPVSGTSPSRMNYSYPSRGGEHQSTLQGLKSAAVGVHGAGETLRSTVNSAVDRRFNTPAEKMAEHDRILQAGRQEMDTGRMPENRPQNMMPVKGILKKPSS
ncbi:MAG: hypothetical protein Q9220_000406 [cf. Caloplaca sp. 1 TL-2023]